MRFWEEPFVGDQAVGYASMARHIDLPSAARPAVLVVDVTMAFCGAPSVGLVEAVLQA